MGVREVKVKSLTITLPHASGLSAQRDGEAMARSVADGLAGALRSHAWSGSVPELRVLLRRDRTSASDVARAIAAAVDTSRGEVY